jgi:acetyl-CoA C-acetyltransferase
VERAGTHSQDRLVVIGCGQVVQRDVPPAEALEPVALMERASRAAAEDAGLGPAGLEGLDAVVALQVIGWPYASPAHRLAASLGARRARQIDTTVGGNAPQSAIHALAARIARGEIRTALVAGAEALRSQRRAREAGVALPWARDEAPAGPTRERLGEERPGVNPQEVRHGLALPAHVYPLFENALRARLGRGLDAHRCELGELWSRFSAVAAANPHAWFRTPRSAHEIIAVSDANRMIAYPYTKYLNAVLEVDQGAAVMVASASAARKLGVPDGRLVHLWGSGEAVEDPWFVSERPRLDRCPAQGLAIEAALAEAGVEAASVGAFDLYSCFPVAVELACEALGIAENDPRPLTVTGGLPFGGGPGNAYSLHAIARMVEHLRTEGGLGLVTALGWYLTKHAAGIYGADPPPAGRRRVPCAVSREPAPPWADAPAGAGVVETYTIVHGRDGAPSRGIVLGRDAGGQRFLANTPSDPLLLEALEAHELVGTRGRLSHADGLTRFDPA